MNPEDRSHSLAARIADGSGIDWAAAESASATPEDQALLRELRAISDVATLHRAPDVSSHQAETTLTSWGPLTVLSPIGTGRFGEVHLAWDARLHRRVALKLLHVTSSSLASPTRAIDEARLLARVRHPSVLTVHGAEVVNEQVGIWTEFIEGQTLEALLAERGPLEPVDVIAIGGDLCRALAAVHDAGLLHRDIKAQNVMRETGGRIVLMDFGAGHDLALAPARDGDLTGTPLYLAPEVLAGGAASQTSDVYALGVLLFHLLTGTHPVTGRTLDDVRRGHQRGDRARLRDLRPELAPALVEIVERALASAPSERFSNATAFGTALERLRTGAGQIEEGVRTPPRGGRRRLWVSLAAVASITAMVLVANSLRPATPGRPGGGDDEIRMPIGAATSATVAKITALDGTAMIGRPSRDGRFLPYIDSVDVWFWNIGPDTMHKVTSLAGSGDSAQFPLMSPDGSRVIYVHYRADLKGSELRIVNADGSEPRTLIPVDQASSPEPLEWSRDGREILCTVLQSDGSTRLMLVWDRGGARTLQTFLQGAPRHASLSPDATFVVYDLPRTTDQSRRDVLIARADRLEAGRILLEGSANSLMPIWTPDGRGVFFVSDRSGSMDGWVVPVTGGVAVGEPGRVAGNLNRASPLGLTDDGQYYFALRTRKHDVYTVDIDGGVTHPATRARVSPTARGGHIAPGWSPRGDFMSYLTTTFNATINDDSHVLTIQELGTGRTHELPIDLAHVGVMAPRWSPDGRSLLIRGRSTEARAGFFAVDLTSRTVTPIVEFDSRVTTQFGAFAWASDSQRIFYLDRQRGIVAADLGGRDVVVVPKSARPVGHSLVVSPDGRRLAFDSGGWIEIADINTGDRHDPLPMNEGVRAIVQAWTPDGRILYTAITRGSDLPPRLWSVAESGGAPLDMGLTMSTDTQQNKLALRPDGRRLAFTEGVIGRELWMMDRFLPGSRTNIPQK